MKQYEEFKKQYLTEIEKGESRDDDSTITLLKKNACLVDIVHGAKGLAEDIFANALEIEKMLNK